MSFAAWSYKLGGGFIRSVEKCSLKFGVHKVLSDKIVLERRVMEETIYIFNLHFNCITEELGTITA